jgi:hypothetical protein
MGIEKKKEKDLSWNYYLSLKKELEVVSDYIEFEEANYQTYSIELAKLLMAASSEVDVVLKQLCNTLNPKKRHKDIKDYRETIQKYLKKDFLAEKVSITRHGLELDPWSNWRKHKDKNPDWWKAYNDVKHQRNAEFSKATLKNALNAMSALLISILYLRAVEWIHPDLENISNAISHAIVETNPEDTFMQLDKYYYGN